MIYPVYDTRSIHVYTGAWGSFERVLTSYLRQNLVGILVIIEKHGNFRIVPRALMEELSKLSLHRLHPD